MKLLNIPDIKKQILDGLNSNYNYPMIDDICIYLDDSHGVSEYYIELTLKDSFEFVFENGHKTNRRTLGFLDLSDYSISLAIDKFFSELYNARLKDLYLYRRRHDMSQKEFSENYDYFSSKLFSKKYEELTKQEHSIILGCVGLYKYNNSKEIVEDFKNFIYSEGRFPFKKEWLYNVLEYAKEVSFISNEDVKIIESISSSYSFDKLCSFIEKEKRWPYQSEFEYSRCWSEVCYSFSKGLYNDDQIIRLDILYSKYNNDKDTLGERLVNSFISSLGYKIEKQKTFEDLIYKRKLKFDTCIHIDGSILLVEYDGPQHFMSVDFFGGEKGLEETQIRDKIKNEYCKINNIPLLRISYKQINEIETLIRDFIEQNTKDKEVVRSIKRVSTSESA